METVNKFHTTDIVSVTLVLFVLFVTATGVFYPKDGDHDFVLLMAIYYGFDIVAIVVCFICTQLNLFSYIEKQHKTFDSLSCHKMLDLCLILNLFLTAIAFLLFVVYAVYYPYQHIIVRFLFEYPLTVDTLSLRWFLCSVLVVNIISGLMLGLFATVAILCFLWDYLIKDTITWLCYGC